MSAKPISLWLDLGLSVIAILATGALTILVTPLIGGPAVTDDPLFYATSITIGVMISAVFRLIQRLMSRRSISTKD